MARSLRVGPLLILALVLASWAVAADPAADFEKAARFDLEGKPQLAFAAYLNAADAGLPNAEFNVAVMLDSGRGVAPDPAGAATWYARAAAHGLSRAAYNLGQLYESGQGVPRNVDLARAWFEASKLPAAYDRLKSRQLKLVDSDAKPAVPELVAPAAGEKVNLDKGVELVWTSKAQPEAAQYYVELRSINESGVREVFSTTSKTSAVFVDILDSDKIYAWRVTVIFKKSGQYASSDWSRFQKG